MVHNISPSVSYFADSRLLVTSSKGDWTSGGGTECPSVYTAAWPNAAKSVCSAYPIRNFDCIDRVIDHNHNTTNIEKKAHQNISINKPWLEPEADELDIEVHSKLQQQEVSWYDPFSFLGYLYQIPAHI